MAGRKVNTTTEYFLGDALGSVLQLTNASGAITYACVYDPYGVVTTTSGTSSTTYGYTGEVYGDSTELSKTSEFSENSEVCFKFVGQLPR